MALLNIQNNNKTIVDNKNKILDNLINDLLNLSSSLRGVDLMRYFYMEDVRRDSLSDIYNESESLDNCVCSFKEFNILIKKYPNYKKKIRDVLYSNILGYVAIQKLNVQFIDEYKLLNDNILD